jgi:hypothetical protein
MPNYKILPIIALIVPFIAAAVSAGAEVSRTHADSLWALRGNPAQARQALEAYREAAKAAPDDYALWARTSRACYLVGHYVAKTGEGRDTLLLAGVEAAKHALMLLPPYRDEMKNSGSEKKAAGKVGKDGLEGLYWYTANLGLWVADKNIFTRLSNKSKLETFNRRILELDETFFYGAAHRFLGALPTKVPGGDLNDSKAHFLKAVAIAPDYFATRTLFAELYATKAKDKEVFTSQLEYVLKTDANALPEVAPENGYEKEIARDLLARKSEFFR